LKKKRRRRRKKLKNKTPTPKVTLNINLHELSMIQTCIALTLASIVETKRKSHDSIPLDPNILEWLHDELGSLYAKLGIEKYKEGEEEGEKKKYSDIEQYEQYAKLNN
jgi:hypothetical protein